MDLAALFMSATINESLCLLFKANQNRSLCL